VSTKLPTRESFGLYLIHQDKGNQMTVTNKTELTQVVLNSLTSVPMTLVEISKEVFLNSGLSPSDDLFYTYQYDMRWSLMNLHKAGLVIRLKDGNRSLYSLSV